MASTECPFCDYTGTVDSVEGHISARTDGGHAGELGRYHREELLQVDDTSNGGESSETHSESVDSEATGGVPAVGIAVVLVALAVVIALRVQGSGGEEQLDESAGEESSTEDADAVPMVEG